MFTEDLLLKNVILMFDKSKVIFIPIPFHNFSNYDCHLFFKTLIDKKPDNVKLSVLFLKQTKNIFQLHMDVFDLLIVIDVYASGSLIIW